MSDSILIVEDDEGVRKYLKELFIEEGYSVQTADDGSSALEKVHKTLPDLVILDLKLPDIEGESVCAEIKEDYPDVVVVMLTAKDSASDVVQGFSSGADDYVKKPFTAEELIARIKAHLRKQNGSDNELVVDDLVMNTKTLEVKRGDEEIQLTPQEYKLLEYLMSNQNQVLTREMILNRIWMTSPDIETRVVDVYIGYLRKKIDKKFDNKLIHSVRGFGYVIKDKSKKDRKK